MDFDDNAFDDKLKDLYKFYQKVKTSYKTTHCATDDMYEALCRFLHFEIKLVLRVRFFYTALIPKLHDDQSLLEVFAQDIKNEFPISKFNSMLQDFLEASIAAPDRSVANASEMTTIKMRGVEILLGMIWRYEKLVY